MAAMAAACTSTSSSLSMAMAAPPSFAAPRSAAVAGLLFLGKPVRINHHQGLVRPSSQPVRATTTTEETTTTTSTSTTGSSVQTDELLADLKAKWDGIENKTNVLIYGGGALVALWLSSTIVGAVNSVPLLPKILELVGLGYTGWFVYRYLLFKESRKELVADVEELKSKIAGTGKE